MKNKAVRLRRKGKTHREIAKELDISLGSAYLWVRGVLLSSEQKAAIQKRRNQHKFTPDEKKAVLERLRLARSKKMGGPEELIEEIRRFYLQNGRIPLKREFKSPRIFRTYFGSWNKAIIVAGFEANPVLFAKKFIAQDGHRCDSLSEKVIDDWLTMVAIAHQRHFKYPGTRLTADFFIEPNTVVEFFGLAGIQKRYDEHIVKKREICKENGFSLIEIYPRDIFPTNKLSKEMILNHPAGFT